MIKYRVRFMEPFKDGDIMQGRFFKAGEVADLTEYEKNRIQNSGGILEILDTLVPNPLKHVAEVEEVSAQIETEKVLSHIKPEETPELAKLGSEKKLELKVPQAEVPSEPLKKKAGRPKKVSHEG